MATLIGTGTLYDSDENELGSVSYLIEHEATPGEPITDWSGELNLAEMPDIGVEAGEYLLVLEDGVRGKITIEPTGAASAGEGQIAFTGRSVVTAL